MDYSIITDETKKRLAASSNLRKLLSEKNLSEHIWQMTLNIIKGETQSGQEQRYQAILKITDIIKGVANDEDARSKLKKVFPQYC